MRHRTVQFDPRRPRDVAIERVADERMPKGHSAGRFFGDDALTEQLIGPGVESGDGPHQLRIEHLARHCRGHRGGARIVGKPGRPKEYGITHAVRQRNIRAVEELQAGRACLQKPTCRESSCEFGYVQGNAVGPVEYGPAQRRRRRPQSPVHQCRGGLHVQRFDQHLSQLAGTAELAAHPPDRMTSR